MSERGRDRPQSPGQQRRGRCGRTGQHIGGGEHGQGRHGRPGGAHHASPKPRARHRRAASPSMTMVQTIPTTREPWRSSTTENDQAWARRPNQEQHPNQVPSEFGQPRPPQEQERQAEGGVFGEVGVGADKAPQQSGCQRRPCPPDCCGESGYPGGKVEIERGQQARVERVTVISSPQFPGSGICRSCPQALQ